MLLPELPEEEFSLTILAIMVMGGLELVDDPDEAHELHEHAADDEDVNEESLLCSLLTSVNNLLTLLLVLAIVFEIFSLQSFVNYFLCSLE